MKDEPSVRPFNAKWIGAGLGLLMNCICGTAAAAGFVDEFADVENRRANNPKTPAEFPTDGIVLTLIDPPGGEATWGTSIYRTAVTIDLQATPYFVAKVVETPGTFGVTLINKKTNEK